MTDDELRKALAKILTRFDAVNHSYIKKVASQIQKIGKMSQATINMVTVMAEITSDVDEITKELQVALNLTKSEVISIYNQAMQDTFTDPRFTKAFRSGLVVPPIQRQRLVTYTRGVAAQTMMKLDNFSNTTAISAPYRDAVDMAVLAVSSGLTSYTAGTRDVIRQIGYNGMQVYYPSGYHRRLDTAVRQNIIDATKQISMHCAEEVGKALKYNAVELSAHMNSAPDHEPVQGRVFLQSEFDRMQSGDSFMDIHGTQYSGFNRPIGEWNCRHFPRPFSTVYSKRLYSNETLKTWADKNNAGCDIDGKHKTIYEASQMMRKIETETRRWKDTAVAAQAAGDDVLQRECQKHINDLAAKYGQIAHLSGLTEHRNRMTVEGFKAVKLTDKTP